MNKRILCLDVGDARIGVALQQRSEARSCEQDRGHEQADSFSAVHRFAVERFLLERPPPDLTGEALPRCPEDWEPVEEDRPPCDALPGCV